MRRFLKALLLATISLSLCAQLCCAMEDGLWNRLVEEGMDAIRQESWQQAEDLLGRSLRMAEKFGENDKRVAVSLVNLACVHAHYKDFEKAISMSKRALAIDKKVYGNSPEVAYDCNQLGSYLDLAGQHAEATPFLEKAVSMRESVGVKPTLIAVSLENLGENMVNRGNLNESADYFRRATTIYKAERNPQAYLMSIDRLRGLYLEQDKTPEIDELYKAELSDLGHRFGSESPWVSRLLSSQMQFYMGRKDYQRAEAVFRRKLKATSVMESLAVAATVNGLAVCLYKQGKYSEAAPYFKQALDQLGLYGDSEQVLAVLEDYVDCLEKMGRKQEAVEAAWENFLKAGVRASAKGDFASAEKSFSSAVAQAEKFGDSDLRLGVSLNAQALFYKEYGKTDEAERLQKRALAVADHGIVPSSQSAGSSFNSLALLYQSQGKFVDAEILYKMALVTKEKTLGPKHPDIAVSFNDLGRLYTVEGKFEAAEYLFRQALAIFEQDGGKARPHLAACLNNLSELYRRQRRYVEAEPLCKRVGPILEQALGPNHPDVATNLNNLALIYEAQGKYAEAEPLFKKALAIYEKSLGPDHPELAITLDNYARFLSSTNREAEAAGLRARASAIRTGHK